MIDFTPLPHVRSVLLPYMADLVAAFNFSLMVNAQNHNYYRTNISHGTLFGGIYEIMYARTRELFANVSEVTVDKHLGQNFISVADQVVLRVKHFNRNFRPSNARTAHNRDWVNQYPLLDPLLGIVRPDFGYRMDPLGIEIQDAFVALRVEDNLIWLWQVLGDQIATPPAQLTLAPKNRVSVPNFAIDNFGA